MNGESQTDQGEVARLRAEIQKMNERLNADRLTCLVDIGVLKIQVESLEAQIAESNKLIRKLVKSAKNTTFIQQRLINNQESFARMIQPQSQEDSLDPDDPFKVRERFGPPM